MKADVSIDPGNYILVKVPSDSEHLTAREIRVMPAKVYQKDEKLFLFFENTAGPKIAGVDDEGKDHDLVGGVFEVMTDTSGGLLIFKSVGVDEKNPKKSKYLGSVYRGSNWGSTFRGVFVDQHEKPGGMGLFLLIPTDLAVELPTDAETTGGEQAGTLKP